MKCLSEVGCREDCFKGVFCVLGRKGAGYFPCCDMFFGQKPAEIESSSTRGVWNYFGKSELWGAERFAVSRLPFFEWPPASKKLGALSVFFLCVITLSLKFDFRNFVHSVVLVASDE